MSEASVFTKTTITTSILGSDGEPIEIEAKGVALDPKTGEPMEVPDFTDLKSASGIKAVVGYMVANLGARAAIPLTFVFLSLYWHADAVEWADRYLTVQEKAHDGLILKKAAETRKLDAETKKIAAE